MTSARTALRRHPSAVLLGVQLIAILGYPFLGESTWGRALLSLFGTLVVLLAVWAVRRTPALTWVAVLLGGPALVFTVLEAIWPDSEGVVLASAALHAPFYFYVSWALIRYLFSDRHVSRDDLFATGAAFTVVAWGFAYLYAAAQAIWPGAFVDAAGETAQSWFDLLFLSFTTLTSVGMSDIIPMRPEARSLVIIEEVAGVMYLALVVARMVGLTVSRDLARR